MQANERVIAGAVSEMRRKERHWPIAPIVGEPWNCVLSIELEHRQEFDSCDSEILEIWDLFDESEIRSS
jgi:hypothetical protein